MAPPRFPARALALLLLAGLCRAATLTTQQSLEPASNVTASPQLASCSCSASARGFNVSDARNLRLVLDQVRAIVALTEPRLGPRIARLAAHLYGVSIFRQCVRRRGYEACVNADAALRAPGFGTFCTYDARTQGNLFAEAGVFRAVPPCDKVPRFRSTQAQLGGNKTVYIALPHPSAGPVIPDPEPTAAPALAPGRGAGGDDGGDDAGSAGSALEQKQGPRGAPATLPLTAPSPTPSASASAMPDRTPPSVVEGEPINEGCVAVEHLRGRVLQHARHLRRRVLCAHGFCATPNHAIVVRGEYTSMRALCAARWNCTRDVRWVNNLKIAANRRASYAGGLVEITPYDARFPKAAAWAAQIAEDVLDVVANAVTAGIFVSAALLAAALAFSAASRPRQLSMLCDARRKQFWSRVADGLSSTPVPLM